MPLFTAILRCRHSPALCRFETLVSEGDRYHSAIDTIRFEGDVILFLSSASALPSMLPFVSKATVLSAPALFIHRNTSSPGRFHVRRDPDPTTIQSSVSRIRAVGSKFAPVITLMSCSADDLDLLFRDASLQNALLTDVLAALHAFAAEGAVLDFYSCMGREQALAFKPQLHRVLAFLGSSILRKKMISVLSVPPIKGSAVVDPQLFAAADFESLEYSFSFFHVAFSAHVLPSAVSTAAPRAPLAWIIKSMRAMLPSGSVKTKRAGKLLASVDMRAAVFSRRRGGWYVDGDGLAQLLRNHTGRCSWDADAMEHACSCPRLPRPFVLASHSRAGTYTSHGERHELFLPSLRGLQVRVLVCRCAAALMQPFLRLTMPWPRSWVWASDGRTQNVPPQCSSTCCKVLAALRATCQ
jgi:hypothetical protein